MRISELSRHSGVPIATIKFYLREGLLPSGVHTARNQAEYDESHVTRLVFLRTLTSIGQLSLSSVREVLAAVENKGLSLQGLCQVVNRALFADHAGTAGVGSVEHARAQVRSILAAVAKMPSRRR